MHKPSVSEILKGDLTSYSLVVGVAKRARQIAEEAEENGEILLEKPVQKAADEFAHGDYRILQKANLGKELE